VFAVGVFSVVGATCDVQRGRFRVSGGGSENNVELVVVSGAAASLLASRSGPNGASCGLILG